MSVSEERFIRDERIHQSGATRRRAGRGAGRAEREE